MSLPTRAARIVVAAVWAALAAAPGASAARAEGPSSDLSVSVAVVRACSVATPELVVIGDELARGAAARVGDAVSLRCSQGGEPSVHVSSGVVTVLF
jgi:hypothetical protein